MYDTLQFLEVLNRSGMGNYHYEPEKERIIIIDCFIFYNGWCLKRIIKSTSSLKAKNCSLLFSVLLENDFHSRLRILHLLTKDAALFQKV